MEEVLRVDGRTYVLATSPWLDDRTRVLKSGESFAVFNRRGDVRGLGQGEQGLFRDGTRHLSRFEVQVGDARPLLLNSSVADDHSLLTVDLTNPPLPDLPPGQVHFTRSRLLWEGVLYEDLRIRNFGVAPAEFPVLFFFEADFADIFEVRGYARPDGRGERLDPVVGREEVVLGYRGLDGLERHTLLRFQPAPEELSVYCATFRVALEPQAEAHLQLSVACRSQEREVRPLAWEDAGRRAREEHRCFLEGMAEVRTSNGQFNAWLTRSLADLCLLTSATEEGPYPDAGVPWFSAPFGRDALVTAMQCLWVDPSMARGVLGFLARHQADRDWPERDAEPGKVLHEMRRGEMANRGEVPFALYYGTADATPLFVCLAEAWWRRTGDRDFLERLWPHVRRAMEWVETHGDPDGDGFVEYRPRAERGLVQQGWKDSADTVWHADGRLAEPPIALCEVQAYAWAARRAAAALAEALGASREADRWRAAADDLGRRFDEAFWCPDLGTYALALDGRKRRCEVVSSNAGHALFSGLAPPERARQVANTLMAEPSFSGWGIRTIAAGQARYNPMSYHNGSVWPHDNGMIALGMAHYGMKGHANRIFAALFEASLALDSHRLPELFCGFVRRSAQGPTIYHGACLPQAWASGVAFMLLQATLGLSFRCDPARLDFVHPHLPDFLEWVEVRNLQVGGHRVDLRVQGQGNRVSVVVLDKDPGLDVAVLA